MRRLKELRLARREAEEPRIEALHVAQPSRRAHVGRIRERLVGDTGRAQLGLVEVRDAVGAAPQLLPELLRVVGPGKPARQPHDGDVQV